MAALIKTRGYTLIELVVVVGLVGMLSVGMVSIFLASLRGSSRAQAEAEARSKGDYAITVIERNLRSATRTPDCLSNYQVDYWVQTDSGPEARSYIYDPGALKITDEGLISLIGGVAGIIVDPPDDGIVFKCNPAVDGSGYGSVTIKFQLRVMGKMSQTVTQVFKTTVAIRSIQ